MEPIKVVTISVEELEALLHRVVTAALEEIPISATGSSMKAASYPEILNMKQVCNLLGFGRRKVLDLIASGKLPLKSGPGEKYRFSKQNVLSLI